MKGKYKLANGEVCASCGTLSVNNHKDTVENIAIRYKENNERLQIFNPKRKIGSSMSTVINIDDEHNLFCIYDKKNPFQIIFKFSEIAGYEYRSVHQTTIVNADGSRTVTKKHSPVICYFINIKTSTGIVLVCITQIPIGLDTFLDFCVLNKEQISTQEVSPADELLKFKQLLDAGAITQEEFDIQKQKLLNR